MIGSGKLSIGKKLLEVYHDFWTDNNQQLSNSSSFELSRRTVIFKTTEANTRPGIGFLNKRRW
jgi:hypothetical protein